MNDRFPDWEGPNALQDRLRGRFRYSWIEESLHVDADSTKSTNHDTARNYLGQSFSTRRLFWFLLIVLLGTSVLLLRSLELQGLRGTYYRTLAEGNRIRVRSIPAERGIIFDFFNRPLVQNVPSFFAAISPQDLPLDLNQRAETVKQAAEIIGIDETEIWSTLQKFRNYRYESLVLKENLDYETALRLYIQSASLPGITIESGTKRDYIFSHPDLKNPVASLSHLLGYLGKLDDAEMSELRPQGYLLSDRIGKSGLEKIYETELRGQYGKKKVEVDALGKEQNVVAEEAPRVGKNLRLTIDLDAQQQLEKAVKKAVGRTGQKRIGAVALDPRDGGIVALVSWPAFDNNLFSGGISKNNFQNYLTDPDHPLFNRVISGTYPSGSTIKLIVAAAALEEKIVTAQTSILSTGGLKIGRWFFKDWKEGGHGYTNVIKALAWSVNTYFYYLGGGYQNFTGLGADKLLHYLRLFNLASLTGIDLVGERPGFLPSREWKLQTKKEPWYIGDTYNLSIGQGDVLVTPLQVAIWTAAMANGGNLIQPHLVKTLIDKSAETETDLTPPIKKERLISPETATIIRQGMRACTLEGSCQGIKYLDFPAGGKTGTAQWSLGKREHAWFTAFAPFQNPQIVVTVLVEEGGEGGTTALPIARDFLSWWGKKYLTP